MPVWKLFLITLMLNAVSFGGGNSVMVGLERELVQTHVISAQQFLAGVALGQSTPGPTAAFSTAVGGYAAGLGGAIAATAAMILVSFGGVVLMQRIPPGWFHLPPVKSALAAISAYIAAVLFFLAYRSMLAGNHAQLVAPVVIAGMVILGRLARFPTVVLMLGSVVLGMALQGTPFAGW